MTVNTIYASERETLPIDRELRSMTTAQVEKYAAREVDVTTLGGLAFDKLDIDTQYSLRADNELKRRAAQAERDAIKQAEAEARQAEHTAAIEDYKAQAHKAWIGDAASFNAAWPELLKRWQIDQVQAAATEMSAQVASMIASGRYSGF